MSLIWGADGYASVSQVPDDESPHLFRRRGRPKEDADPTADRRRRSCRSPHLFLLGLVFCVVVASVSVQLHERATTPALHHVEKLTPQQLVLISHSRTDTVSLDVIIRDFKDDHPDFERIPRTSESTPNLLKPQLGLDGKPALNVGGDSIASRESFHQWYHNDPRVNRVVPAKLQLAPTATGTLVADLPHFFPIDGLGWGDVTLGHNFWFTLELRHDFVYHGGEQFTFRGDDDLWVFINGTLALDLGGMHAPLEKTVELDNLGLTQGSPASLDIFFAERHTSDSHFRIETSIKLGEDPCASMDHPFIQLNSLVQNNLGGTGPDLGEDAIILRGVSFVPGAQTDVELSITVKPGSGYKPSLWPHNGLRLHHGSIGVEAGTNVSLLFRFSDPWTREPLNLQGLVLTFHGIDPGRDGKLGEYVQARDFSARTLAAETQVQEAEQSNGWWHFHSAGLMEQDLAKNLRKRAVSLHYPKSAEIEVVLGTGDAAGPDGYFRFEVRPSLQCGAGNTDTRVTPSTAIDPSTVTTTRMSSAEGNCCVIEWPRIYFNFVCFPCESVDKEVTGFDDGWVCRRRRRRRRSATPAKAGVDDM